MNMYPSISNFIKKKLVDKIIRAISNYVYSNNIEIETNFLHNVHEKELYDIEIINVRIFDEPEMLIKFDCIICCEYHLYDRSNGYSDYDNVDKWFKVCCRGDLSKDLNDTIVIGINEAIKQDRNINQLNDSLVPVFTKDELDIKAAEFLKIYYPEALKEPIYISGEDLIEKMGLKLKVTTLSTDGSIFGQIYFKEGKAILFDSEEPEEVDIKKGTILIDKDISFLRNFGSQNNTMVHECVHWHFHKKAFELERILNGDLSKIECKTSGDMKEFKNHNISSMEWQANALAPKILMPKNTFKEKTFELIQNFKKSMNTKEVIDVIEPVINELSTFFMVSKLSAKIRLIELGYTEARGAFEYVDSKYVKPYTFKKGSLKANQTFSIPYIESVILRYVNPEFNTLIQNYDFKFIDSHYVINDPKYLQKNLFDEFELTNYARTHMDECAIAFDISFINEKFGEYELECYLNRDVNSPVKIRYESADGKNLSQKELFQLRLIREKEEEKLLQSLPNNLVGAIEKLMEENEIEKEDLLAYSDVSERTLNRILSGEVKKPTRETIAQICVGLQTSFPISMFLFKKAGHTLEENDDDTILIKSAIKDLSGLTIQEFRELVNPHLKKHI